MDSFNQCIEKVLGHEGGYVNDPKDPGGETNWGISKRAYPNLDIKNLTKEDAKKIYYEDYWLKSHCHKLPDILTYPVFDSAINQGISSAIKLLQKTLNVKEDGIFGEITKGKLNKISVAKLRNIKRDLLTERILKYTNTKNFDRFGRGWTRRVIDIAMG